MKIHTEGAEMARALTESERKVAEVVDTNEVGEIKLGPKQSEEELAAVHELFMYQYDLQKEVEQELGSFVQSIVLKGFQPEELNNIKEEVINKSIELLKTKRSNI